MMSYARDLSPAVRSNSKAHQQYKKLGNRIKCCLRLQNDWWEEKAKELHALAEQNNQIDLYDLLCQLSHSAPQGGL